MYLCQEDKYFYVVARVVDLKFTCVYARVRVVDLKFTRVYAMVRVVDLKFTCVLQNSEQN